MPVPFLAAIPRSPRVHRAWRMPMLAAALTLVACAETLERPRNEDEARLLAPLPACLMAQHARAGGAPDGGAGEGVGVSLKEEQYWQLVYPAYDPPTHALSSSPRACTGVPLLQDPLFAGGAPLHDTIEEGDVALGGGADRLRVAWLRSSKFADGTVGGALVLARSHPAAVELFAVGVYRGRPERSRLSIERLGPEVVVVVTDDGCSGRAAGAACDTTTQVFLPREGVLRQVAKFANERVAYLTDSEPGIRGRFEYRLSSAPEFILGGIRVQEQVMVKDEQGREVRKAELSRSFTFAPDESMVVSDDSLWTKIFRAPKPG